MISLLLYWSLFISCVVKETIITLWASLFYKISEHHLITVVISFLEWITSSDITAFLNNKLLIKILTLNLYYEDKDKLDAFLIQVNVYARTHKKLSSFHDKILFAFSYFKEDVFKWFKSLIRDHLKNKSEDQEEETNRIFEDFFNFEQAIRRMYEDINAKRIIERQLYDIKQSESAFKYIAAFQSIAAKTEWNNSTFTAQFYKELKNVIKNEIAHMNKLATLHAMISKTIVLNNQQYERRLEKKNKIAFASVAWSKKKKKQSYYNSQSMKLDAIWKISTNARDKTVQQSKACYTCKKLNHFFRDCIQNKYKNKSKLYDKQDKSFAAMKEDQKDKHQALSWTACYEDNCCTHLSNKKDSEWYLKSSWKNHFYAAIHRQSKVHDEKSNESSFTMIAKSKIFDSEEYDSNKLNSTEEAIHQAVKKENRLSEILWAFIIATEDALKEREDYLEVKKDFRKLTNQASFISMYNELYTLFRQKEKDFLQRMQQIKNKIHQTIYDVVQDELITLRKDIQYHDIVMKKSFTEVKFIKQEEYVLLDEDHIFRELKQMTKVIRKRFDLCDSKKYLQKKINSNQFQYIEQVLEKQASSSKKN